MNIFESNGVKYVLRKKFSSDRIKDMAGLEEIKEFYNADTIVLDPSNKLVILASIVEDAQILEYTHE